MVDLDLSERGDRPLDGTRVLHHFVAGVQQPPDAIELLALCGTRNSAVLLQFPHRAPQHVDIDRGCSEQIQELGLESRCPKRDSRDESERKDRQGKDAPDHRPQSPNAACASTLSRFWHLAIYSYTVEGGGTTHAK